MLLAIHSVGLAAYLKEIKNIPLQEYSDGNFMFDTDISEDAWRVEYLNSESYLHDQGVMSLRTFKQRDKKS